MEIDKVILKFMWYCKAPRIVKAMLNKKQIWRMCTIRFQDFH